MICTTDDYFTYFQSPEDSPENRVRVENEIKFASVLITKFTLTSYETSLPISHPLNKACRLIAYYELHPEIKKEMSIKSEKLEGYSWDKKESKVPEYYGIEEIDRIIFRYDPLYRKKVIRGKIRGGLA